MRLPRRSRLLPALLMLVSITAFALRVGDPAPDFTGTDSNGQKHSLSEYKGKYVVLEWTNNCCPYTRKHYDSASERPAGEGSDISESLRSNLFRKCHPLLS